MPASPRLSALAATVALVSLAACQSQPAAPPPAAAAPPPSAPVASTTHTKQLVATVESVDLKSRQVLLRTPGGTRATVVAGPEVVNLPQLKSGDQVTITYREAVAARIAPPGSLPPDTAAVAATGNMPGQMPGGAVGSVVAGRVKIVSAAPDGTSVTFLNEKGVTHSIDVQDPKMQAFVQTLKPGDMVDVAFANEVAIRVDPMQ
jgi:hypothetical protein